MEHRRSRPLALAGPGSGPGAAELVCRPRQLHGRAGLRHRSSRDDRQRYREKVKRCLDVFARMLRESQFDPGRRSVGLEIELNLTDEAGDPAMVNARALELIANPDFQTELGQFNVEINIPTRCAARVR